jgi:hypothetical protein
MNRRSPRRHDSFAARVVSVGRQAIPDPTMSERVLIFYE